MQVRLSLESLLSSAAWAQPKRDNARRRPSRESRRLKGLAPQAPFCHGINSPWHRNVMAKRRARKRMQQNRKEEAEEPFYDGFNLFGGGDGSRGGGDTTMDDGDVETDHVETDNVIDPTTNEPAEEDEEEEQQQHVNDDDDDDSDSDDETVLPEFSAEDYEKIKWAPPQQLTCTKRKRQDAPEDEEQHPTKKRKVDVESRIYETTASDVSPQQQQPDEQQQQICPKKPPMALPAPKQLKGMQQRLWEEEVKLLKKGNLYANIHVMPRGQPKRIHKSSFPPADTRQPRHFADTPARPRLPGANALQEPPYWADDVPPVPRQCPSLWGIFLNDLIFLKDLVGKIRHN